MKLDKTLANLKKLHEGYQADVARLTAEVQAANEELNAATALESQTQDAIDALEGRPSLKSRLEEVLLTSSKQNIQNSSSLDQAAGEPASAVPAGLPPPEPGTRWAVRYENGEAVRVLIPINIPDNGNSAYPQESNLAISLPAISEDETFESPESQI